MGKLTTSNRSGGPRTDVGKQASSKNALKAGVYSPLVILPGESEADFLALEAQFFADFQVEGIAEAAMARDLAVLTWKRMRLEQLEHRMVLDRLNRKPSADELREVGLSCPLGAEDYLKGFLTLEDSEIPGYRERLKQVQGYIDDGIKLPELQRLEAEDEDLFDWIAKVAEEIGLVGPTVMRILNAEYGAGSEKRPLLNRVLGNIKHEIECILWLPDHQSEVDEAAQKVKDRRLLTLMRADGSRRAFDDLARNFYRTLSELRKQQEWRRKQQVIDVTPESSDER